MWRTNSWHTNSSPCHGNVCNIFLAVVITNCINDTKLVWHWLLQLISKSNISFPANIKLAYISHSWYPLFYKGSISVTYDIHCFIWAVYQSPVISIVLYGQYTCHEATSSLGLFIAFLILLWLYIKIVLAADRFGCMLFSSLVNKNKSLPIIIPVAQHNCTAVQSATDVRLLSQSKFSAATQCVHKINK